MDYVVDLHRRTKDAALGRPIGSGPMSRGARGAEMHAMAIDFSAGPETSKPIAV